MFEPGDLIRPPDPTRSFRVQSLLGSGGQGSTYRCIDEQIGGSVVIKCTRVGGTSEEQARLRARLEREASFLRQAADNSPHIPKVYDAFEVGSQFAIVMQDVQARPLADVLRDVSFDLATGLRVCRQVASALDVVHALLPPIIHRDIKPGNILVDSNGTAWLIDFGYARLGSSGDGESTGERAPLTAPGRQPYTAGYASPEQELGHPLSPASDIFSFGCTLYECVAKKRAFPTFRTEFEGDQAKIDRLAYPVGLPSRVRQLIDDCLQAQRTHRPASASVHRELQRSIEDLMRPSGSAPGERRVHNLPRRDALFVGRDPDLQILQDTILQAEGAAVALAGYGGVGKTATAIELGHRMRPEFKQGVWLVNLSGASSREALVRAIAEVLGIQSLSAAEALAQIERAIDRGRVLLILDGCDAVAEHVADVVADLTAVCERLSVIVTARCFLPGFTLHRALRGLKTPPQSDSFGFAEQLAAFGAVQLFQRVASLHTSSRFDDLMSLITIANIVRQLDGVPLAIRLTAPLVRCCTLAEIEASLQAPGGTLPEERAAHILERTFRSSFERLSAEEHELLHRLTVFEGGWTTAAAQSVCTDEAGAGALDGPRILRIMVGLSDKSLIEPGPTGTDGATRYRMLRSVRRHVLREMAGKSADRERIALRHFEWSEQFATNAEAKLDGENQARVFAELHDELANIVTALGFARDRAPLRSRGLDLTCSLRQYWYFRGAPADGIAWLDAFAREREAAEPARRAKLANAAGVLAEAARNFERARCEYEAALALYRGLGDRQRIASMLNNLSTTYGRLGDWDRCQALFHESMAIRSELNDTLGMARAQLNFSSQLIERGRFSEASRLLKQALPAFDSDKKRRAMALNNLGECDIGEGKFADALRRFKESLSLKAELGDKRTGALTYSHLTRALIGLDRHADAAWTLGRAVGLLKESGERLTSLTDLEACSAALRSVLGAAELEKRLKQGELGEGSPGEL